MSAKPELVYKLKCSCNSYPWGKQGSNSLGAQLCQKQPGWQDGPKSDFKIDENSPYAEMWMGTYPVLPSYVASTGEDLQDVIDRYPAELIGENVMRKFGHSKLPFLPKVLSMAKALPLQLHPDIEMSKKFHKERPQAFTDPNHKPEIALALTEFEAFCGFKPLNQIKELMKLQPLTRFLPVDLKGDFNNEHLREVVKKMLEADENTVRDVYSGLVSISSDQYKSIGNSHILRLAPRLARQYGEDDNGLLVALITMNYVVLQPGESIYVPADGIHAWLSGDIIECMARSNNVLNTGFCPRAERNNAELFCSCLTFTPHSVDESMLRSSKYDRSENGKTKLYAPPMSEFNMLETSLKATEKDVLGAVGGPSIALATKGSAHIKAVGGDFSQEVKEGQVLFVAHGVKLEIEAGSDGLLMHTAYVE